MIANTSFVFLKLPIINELEKQTIDLFSKHQNYLIERRRQDVRDEAKEFMLTLSKKIF